MNKWLILLFLLLSRAGMFADGGVVQFQKDAQGLRITLFSQSAPLHAGPADLSVLVQKTDDIEPILDADITLHLKCEKKSPETGPDWKPLCCSMNGGMEDITLKATHDQASNKLLYAASAIFPYSGIWNVTVTATHAGKTRSVTDTMVVRKPADPWIAYLPYLLLPGFGVCLFTLAQKAKQDRRKKSCS